MVMSLPRQKPSYADNRKPLRLKARACSAFACDRTLQSSKKRVGASGAECSRSAAWQGDSAGRHVQEGLSKALRQHPGIIAPKIALREVHITFAMLLLPTCRWPPAHCTWPAHPGAMGRLKSRTWPLAAGWPPGRQSANMRAMLGNQLNN